MRKKNRMGGFFPAEARARKRTEAKILMFLQGEAGILENRWRQLLRKNKQG